MAAKGIRRIIELAIDAASARRMQRDAQAALKRGTDPSDAQKNLRAVEGGFDRLHGAAVRIGAAIAGAFAVIGIKNFVESSVRAFSEAEVVWNRLSGTLRAVGVDFADVRGEIEAHADALQRTTRFDDEDFAGSLQTLVRITGNYRSSLGAVQTAANLAVGAQIDLNAASVLVGKAMNGNTATLQRYGIQVKEGENALAAIQARFAGMAENELNTFGGRLAQVNNYWMNFKEAVGEALVSGVNGSSMFDTLRGSIERATVWVGNNRDAIAKWTSLLADAVLRFAGWGATVVGWIGKLTVGIQLLANDFTVSLARMKVGMAYVEMGAATVAQGVVDSFDFMFGWVIRAAESLPQSVRKLLGLEDAIESSQRVRRETNAAMDVARGRIRAAEWELAQARRLAARREAEIMAPGQVRPSSRGGTGLGGEEMDEPGGRQRSAADQELARLRRLTATDLARIHPVDVGSSIDQGMTERIYRELEAAHQTHLFNLERDRVVALHRVEQAWIDSHAELIAVTQDAAQEFANAWGDAFTLLFEHGASFGEFMEEVARGTAAALLGGLAQFARGKVMEEVAEGFAMLAKAYGNPPMAPVYLKSAAMHGVAAGAWSALAGFAGASAGSVGRGGGGGGPSGSRDAGLDTAQNARPLPPEIHVYVNGFDADDPRHQDMALAGVRKGEERWGDQIPTIRHHPAREWPG